jgi:CheY-like chemotaxis protein
MLPPVNTDPASLSVLFVDDDADTLHAYGRCLEASGLEVTTTSDPLEAVNLARANPPDVIVLDVAMPVVSGYEVVRALEERPETRQIPVVFFSGLPVDRTRPTPPQVVAAVRKPCMPADLVRVVKTYGGRE